MSKHRFKPRPLVDRNDIVFRTLVKTANDGVPHKEKVLFVSYIGPSPEGVVIAQLGRDDYGQISDRVLNNLVRADYLVASEPGRTLLNVRLKP